MNKVLIVSDTHQNYKLLADILRKNSDCKYLIHLGDEPDDLDDLFEYTKNMQIYNVYGLYHQKITKDNVCKEFSINDINFVICHAQEYLKPSAKNSIYCYGHTHKRCFSVDGQNIFLNPGHLKKEIDRNEVASYIVLSLDEKIIRFCDFTGMIIEEHNFTNNLE
jgi:putative phosphoesterase